jgi:hypothetical protein
MDYAVSTPHPYPLNFTESYTVKVEGAKRLAVHFSKFELEKSWDIVEIYDVNGTLLGSMTGSQDGEFSPYAEGDTIVVKLISDDTEPRYGFDIDQVAAQK